MRSNSTRFKEPSYDSAFGNWLAGFVDGEGSFFTGGLNGGNYRGWTFSITLREDDRPILEEIREQLGCGRISFVDKSRTVSRDQYTFFVTTVVDLIDVLIPLFDTHPLRAKKLRDYIAWRTALLARWGEVGRSAEHTR